MAENATLARPYARAAFEFARDAKALAGWGDLLATAAVVVTDERFAALIGSPEPGPAALAGVVLDIAGGSADEHGRNFVRLLAQNRRLALLPEIAAQFARLRAEVENTVDVEVASALPLTGEQTEQLARALTRRLNRRVRLHASVDPSLIGGAVVRAGDFVLDGSLKGRLERLAQSMTN
ncbi:MAG: F0F1 ATP synthase subunit delta [Steroidobacteraceae bacterium]|nr:F0F1 ATP synthase subunit delta [Steroidobacteraceae bacterium]